MSHDSEIVGYWYENKSIIFIQFIIYGMNNKESQSEELTFRDMVVESSGDVNLNELYKSNKGL